MLKLLKRKKKKGDDAEAEGEEAEEKEDKKEEKDAEQDKGADEKEGEAAEGGEEGAEGAPKKRSKKKMIIIGVVALLILVGGAAGAYFSGVLGESGVIGDDADAKRAAAEKAVYYTLPEFLINLNTGTRSSSFLKTTIILEVAKQEDIPLIEANLPRLVDAVNTYMRELRASDLSGSAGIQRLRDELLIRCNTSLAPIKVNDVLFKEIVVQ